jgi:23S rRNA pseudouridine1911/1915/1917 synthase
MVTMLCLKSFRATVLPLPVMRSPLCYSRGLYFSSIATRGGPISILHEDNHVIMVSKPPTILTQGDNTKDENLLDLVKAYIGKKYNKPGDVYLGLIHRLDRPCSGVVVLARTSKAAARLSESFRNRVVTKRYVCVVHGRISSPGVCRNMLSSGGGDSSNSSGGNVVKVVDPSQFARLNERQQDQFVEATLRYRPLITFALPNALPVTAIEVDLGTGRKHQIRAQMAHLGHPVCGDVKYGAPRSWLVPAGGGVADHAGTSVGGGGGGGGGGGEGNDNNSSSSMDAARAPRTRERGGKGRLRRSDFLVPFPAAPTGTPTATGGGGDCSKEQAVGGHIPGGIAVHAYSLTVPHPTAGGNGGTGGTGALPALLTCTAQVPEAWAAKFGAEAVSDIHRVLGLL